MSSPVKAKIGEFLVMGMVCLDDTFFDLDLLLDDPGLNDRVLGVEAPIPDGQEKQADDDQLERPLRQPAPAEHSGDQTHRMASFAGGGIVGGMPSRRRTRV